MAAGRIDNPEHYTTLYHSGSPAGACAEVFDFIPLWQSLMLRDLDDRFEVCDLDDAARLVEPPIVPATCSKWSW
jgi:hypothetical protein